MTDEIRLAPRADFKPLTGVPKASQRPATWHSKFEPSHGLSLRDRIGVLHKRRWTALMAFVIVFVTAAVETFSTTPIYQAQTQLLIEADKPNIAQLKGANEEQVTADFYPTQYSLLKSRSIARRTLATLKLWDHPEFGGTPNGPVPFSPHAAVTQALGHAKGYVMGLVRPASSQPASSIAAGSAAEERAIDALLSRLTVAPVRSSRLVYVTYESPDPVLAAQVLNTHARMYIEQSLEFKYLASKESSDWLGERLFEERKKVEEAEQALQRYREQHESVSLEDRQNIVVQKLTDLNAAVTKAKTERVTKQTLYSQLISLQSDPARIDTFPAILQDPLIQQLKAQLTEAQRQQAQLSNELGPKHPDMAVAATAIKTTESKLQAEITKVALAVRNEYLNAQEQERSLTLMLEDQKRDALKLNQIGIEYGVLQRNAESTHKLYETLLQRTNETNVAGESKTSNVRVVDPAAVPRVPVRPDYTANLELGLVAGVCIAMALAFFFEYFDNRIKGPDDVKTHLHLPLLGLVPAIRNTSKETSPLLCHDIPAGFSEAFRSVRTNVLFSSASDEVRTIVVTSAAPREGKTVVSCNLAMALAQAGRRVLLIDADLRRPRVHQAFGYPQEPGLSNFLVDKIKGGDVVRKSSVPGLYVLVAGKRPPNPAELLGSRRFIDFTRSLGEHFDWVVIDSPPTLPVADAPILAHEATGVVFVVGTEMTSRHAAQNAIEQLEKAGAHMLGVVLNRVKLERNKYYYSPYYRADYAEYYSDSKTA